MAKVEI